MPSFSGSTRPRPCAELLKEYACRHGAGSSGSLLNFAGVPVGQDVYNITPPFVVGGREIVAGRMESRDSDWVGALYDPRVVFFARNGGRWRLLRSWPRFAMEDPSVVRIGGWWVLSGVRIYDDSSTESGRNFRTVFYRGRDFASLEAFAEGPPGMKDIRLSALPSGRVAVFTRPQGGPFGLGKIGFTELSGLDDLSAQRLAEAPLIADCFVSDEWGGVNQVLPLAGGLIGCVGHVAYRDDVRHYYAAAFLFDPESRAAGPLRIIATRADFPAAPPKSPDIDDCVFPGGVVRVGGMTTLYAGVADAYAGRRRIRDPFRS